MDSSTRATTSEFIAQVPSPQRSRDRSIEYIKEHLDKLDGQLACTSDEAESLKKRLANAADEVASLRDKLRSAQEEASKRSRECWHLRAQIKELAAELKVERHASAQLRSQLVAAQDANSRLEARSAAIEQSQNERFAVATEERVNHASETSKLAEDLRCELVDAANFRAEAEARVAEAQTCAQVLQQQLVGSQLAQATAEAKAVEAEEIVESMRRDLAELVEAHAAAVTAASEANAYAQQQVAAARQAQTMAHAEVRDVESISNVDVMEVRRELAGAQAAIVVGRVVTAALVRVSDARLCKANAGVLETEALVVGLEERSAALEVQNATAVAFTDRLQQDIKEMSEECSVCNANAARASAKAADAEAHAERLREELMAAQEATAIANSHAAQIEETAQALLAAQSALAGDVTASECNLRHAPASMQVQAAGGAHGLKPNEASNKLHQQNRELSLTVLQLKGDCEHLEAENAGLKKAMASFEVDLDQHVQSIGHANHKQKIRYTMQLKDQINGLLADLQHAKRQIVQLQASRTADGLLDALASLGLACSVTTNCNIVGKSQATERQATLSRGMRPATPPKVPMAPPLRKRTSMPGSLFGVATSREEMVPAWALDEADHKLEMQEIALERIGIDFLHLKALVERVVVLANGQEQCDGVSFADLLRRLRHAMGRAVSHRAHDATAGPLQDELQEAHSPGEPVQL